MTVWIVQSGEPLPIDPDHPRPMRAINLAGELVERSIDVVLWSANFCHQTKKHRYSKGQTLKVSNHLQVKLIDSPGYKKNASLQRIIDHIILGRNLQYAMLREQSLPDLVFVGFPPIETSFVSIDYCLRNKIPSLLDVKDQWPDIFIEQFPDSLRTLAYLIFYPLAKKARFCMRSATGICSITQEFLNWTLQKIPRDRSPFDIIASLSPPEPSTSKQENQDADEWWNKNAVLGDEKYRICFAGNLGEFIELGPLIRIAEREVILGKPFEIIICGGGDHFKKWQIKASKNKNIKFFGRVNFSRLQSLYRRSTVLIAPIRRTKDYEASIPNKILEGVRYQLPVVTTLRGPTQKLLESSGLGCIYDPANEDSLWTALKTAIYLKKKTISNPGKTHPNLPNDLQGREVYKKLSNHILNTIEHSGLQYLA